MFKNKWLKILLTFMFCISIFLTSASASASIPGANEIKVQQQLKDIAVSKLAAQSRILIDGLKTEAISQDANYASYAQALDIKNIATLRQEKDMLASHNIRYTSFQTELTVDKTTTTNLQTILSASEYTKYNMVVLDANGNVDPLAPTVTEYVLQHTFTFNNVKGKWSLVKDRLDDLPASIKPDSSMHPIKVQPSNTTLNMSADAESAILPGSTSINKAKIAAYAITYGKNHNPSYRTFYVNGKAEDCTNFVSQAVRYGGWSDVYGLYTLTSYWWYNSINQTRTWTSAHYWWWFTYNRPRAYIARYISDLQVGDILQADWTGDGYIDHSMVVTKRDSNGTIYLTYHSNDTINNSFWNIYYQPQYSKAKYYGWRLYSPTN